ncbi:hypothetical protein HYZ06_02465 [Candidatus Daviesbacteria bacterium]|nr:hypothetical protein [Candidatus Daviesbacteria bacterium]
MDKRKLLWILGILFVLSPILVVLAIVFIPKLSLWQKAPLIVPSEKTLDENESPIAFDILKNPLVYEWRGSVEGTLVAKDEKSITLTDDKGNKITIMVESSSKEITGGTRFFKNKPTKDPRTNFIDLKDIPVGTKLLGDFFVFPHRKNELVGSSFNIVE